MSKLFLRIIKGLGVFLIPCLVLAVSDNSVDTKTKTQVMTASDVRIQCSEAELLAFCGVPNETKTGEITFTLQGKSGFAKFLVTVTGSAFENGNLFLDSEFQPSNTELWYEAGKPFTMLVNLGQTNTIKYQVMTGPKILSQQAGAYTAKLSFVVTPYHK